MTFDDSDAPSVLALPTLRVAGGARPASLGLGPVVAPGTEWADVDGRIAIRTALHASGVSVELIGVGIYAAAEGRDVVDAWPAQGRSDAVVAAEFDRSVVPLLLSYRGALYVHASGVVAGGAVVALCGRSGTGKSTMAAALDRAGCAFWADDAVVFSSGTARALPVTVRLRSALRLDETGAHLAGPLKETGTPTSPGELRPLKGVLVLERAEAGPPRLERLTSGAALAAVLEHALCFSLGPGEREELVRSYLAVVERVPIHRLVFTPVSVQFRSVVDLLHEHLMRLESWG